MERILITQDNKKLEKILDQFYWDYQNVSENVKQKYEALNLGKFNLNVLNNIKRNDSKSIRLHYEEELNKQLDANGVSFPALRKQMFEGSLPPLREFEEAFDELQSIIEDKRNEPYKFEYISYNEKEECFLTHTDEAKEDILENHCRLYTENDKESAMYTASQQFLEAYLEYVKVIKENGMDRVFMFEGKLDLSKILISKDNEAAVLNDIVGLIRVYERHQQYRIDRNEAEIDKRKKEEERIASIDWLDLTDPNFNGKFQERYNRLEQEKAAAKGVDLI